MALPPSKQLDQFVLRLPDGMRDRIKAAAEAANRSMNAEIVATLEDRYPAPDSLRVRLRHTMHRMRVAIETHPGSDFSLEDAVAIISEIAVSEGFDPNSFAVELEDDMTSITYYLDNRGMSGTVALRPTPPDAPEND